MAQSLLLRLSHALQWAHKQRKSFIVRAPNIKLVLHCDARSDVAGLELISALVEEIERAMPDIPAKCILCESDPCICHVPF